MKFSHRCFNVFLKGYPDSCPNPVLLKHDQLMLPTCVPILSALRFAFLTGGITGTWCCQLERLAFWLHLSKFLPLKDLINSTSHAALPDHPAQSSPLPSSSLKPLFMALSQAYTFFLALMSLCADLFVLLCCNAEGRGCFRM